jgi:hypothetical protein
LIMCGLIYFNPKTWIYIQEISLLIFNPLKLLQLQDNNIRI